MFITFSLIIFWIIMIIILCAAFWYGEVETILLSVVFMIPGLAFITFAGLYGGWIMPIICIWITLIAVGAMITS